MSPHERAENAAAQLAQFQALVLSEPVQAEQELLQFLQSQEKQPVPDAASITHALILLAGCAFYRGDYPRMLAWAHETLRKSRAAGLPTLEARALNSIGLVHQRTGDLVQAMGYFVESLSLAEAHADLEGQCRALLNIALVHTSLGEYSTALKLHEQALLAARVAQVPAFIADALYGRLEDHYHQGHYAQVLELGQETLAYVQTHQLARLECGTRAVLGLALLHLGRLEACLQTTVTGQEMARRVQDLESLCRLKGIEGQALVAHQTSLAHKASLAQSSPGDTGASQSDQPGHRYSAAWGAAQAALEESLSLSQKLGAKSLESEAHAGLAKIYEQQQDFQAAYYHLERERQLSQELLKAETSSRSQQLAVKAHLQAHQERGGQVGEPAANWAEQEALNALQEDLKDNYGKAHQEVRDELTGMVSRPYFQARVEKTLELLGPGEHLALLFVAVDHLQTITETHGNAVADAVLVEVARRLSDNVRSGDLVGRMSQGEFMVMLGHLAHQDDLKYVMDKLLLAVRQPMLLPVQGHELAQNETQNQPQNQPQNQQLTLYVTVSLGGVVAPHDGTTPESLYHHADLALRQVQQNGRNSALRFMPYMSAEEQQKRTLEYELRGAVARQELRVYYQGQFDLQAGPAKPLVGYEALVRWEHPRLGLVPPGQFIPLAEESRLILEIGDWVLKEACRQAAAWNFAGRGLTMSVNVSAVQFGQPNFVDRVREVLQDNGLNGENLTLELTETMVHEDEQRAAQNIRELQAWGVQVALDDFGTGYSSLSMLQNLPFHVLKIDRSFLNDLRRTSGSFERAWTLLELLVKLAHNLNMEVVAEGLEQEEQWDLLHELGCNSGQGYWLSRPLPAEQAALLL